jgi:hypothetical protein
MPGRRLYLLLLATLHTSHLAADDFEYLDRKGQSQSIQGQIYAADRSQTIVQLDDGSLKIIPSALITKRESKEGPEFITSQQTLNRLKTKYGPDLFRGIAVAPFVVGVVLQSPVPEENERRLSRALEKSAGYMSSIEGSFDTFMASLDIQTTEPQVPLTLLIFESDDDFEAFARERFGKASLSAKQVKGFYSNLTNVLYVRMSECASFDTPLHEAIHLLCFNKGLFKRLAPVPLWLAEGMACSFEGAGTSSRSNPTLLNSEYAAELIEEYRRTGRPTGVGGSRANPNVSNWNAIVEGDGIYRQKELVNDAYINAWSLHWILVRNHRANYAKYVKYIQALQPLEDVDDDTRLAEFRKAFAATPATFEKPFLKEFELTAKKSRQVRNALGRVGVSRKVSNLAAVSIHAARDSQSLVAYGELKNTSPFREMAFYVCVQTDGGRTLQWFLPNVGMGRSTKIRRQQSPGGGTKFRVAVRSAPADSPEAAAWASGRIPVIPNPFTTRPTR